MSKKKKRDNRREYQRKNTRLRNRIAAGMSVQCLACKANEQLSPSLFYRGKARCSACGGSVERIHAPRTELSAELDKRRVVPRKFGCKVRGQNA